MKELKPFGDVPDKLAVQIKRSFVATRTYWQALHTAAEVSKKMMNVSSDTRAKQYSSHSESYALRLQMKK